MDNLPNILKEDSYSDVQAFMRTFQKMQGIAEQYNYNLAQWTHQINTKAITANQKRHRPPKKQSVLKYPHKIQERNRQKPSQRKKSLDRDHR